LGHPGELKPGYTPIAYVRTAHSAVRMSAIEWRVGKETGGAKLADAPHLKAGDIAQVRLVPQQPFVVDAFQRCAGLGRVAIMEGASCVMIGKIVDVQLQA
jgi:elongation factor 1-alpha